MEKRFYPSNFLRNISYNVLTNLLKIILTVTNDLTYDQRMIRICTSLANAGFNVVLVGRQLPVSKPFQQQPFIQKRLKCWFNQGKFFYIEYNIRLFFFLLFTKFNIVCSIDLDTILAGFWVAKLKNKTCVYDAHEYFTEVPEVVERPKIQAIWQWVANHTIPHLKYCYTVCESLAIVFKKEYGTDFEVIRNVPFKTETPDITPKNNHKNIVLYQGVLNDGRGLEQAIEAMQKVPDAEFWLAGEGDLSKELRQLVVDLKLENKVKFLGYLTPPELKKVTQQATIGLNLLQNKGLNYYYSLANKAFDYIQNEKPSINMKFPEYERLNAAFETFVLIENLDINLLAHSINNLLKDKELYSNIQKNCSAAKEILNWEKEEAKLIAFYKNIAVYQE